MSFAEAGLRGEPREVREYGKIVNTPTAVKALATKLAAKGNELRFCYEVGPCGYGVQRQPSGMGHQCAVVAPSLVPRKPGERIKTDRRDAIKLAKMHRADELTPAWVPDQAHEAVHDLVCARLAAVRRLRQARQQLSGFLLRHGHHYHRAPWTVAHRRWLAASSSTSLTPSRSRRAHGPTRVKTRRSSRLLPRTLHRLRLWRPRWRSAGAGCPSGRACRR